jgi:serine/threonine protein kinase
MRAVNFDEKVFLREVECLAALNHPCVLRIVGWSPVTSSGDAEIHTELAENGSLDRILTRPVSILNPTQLGTIICDIVLGMRYVHSRQIIHRDLKPSNILISGTWRALIGDFGSGRSQFDEGTLTPDSGTVHYAAPEQFEEQVCTTKVDVFSFGLIIYELLLGRPLFPVSMSPFAVIRAHRDGTRPAIPDSVGAFMQQLIGRCWSANPDKRPQFQEILDECRAVDFAMLPNSDRAAIRDAVEAVWTWEERSGRSIGIGAEFASVSDQ